MHLLRLTAIALVLLPAAPASAANTVQYGALSKDFAVVHPGASVPLLLMHEASHTYEQAENIANGLHADGFTVLNLEWDEATGTRVWEHDVGQIEAAVAYVPAHAAKLGVDAGRLTMLGGSRGANLALLTSMDMDAAAPGTVKIAVEGRQPGHADRTCSARRTGKGDPRKTVESLRLRTGPDQLPRRLHRTLVAGRQSFADRAGHVPGRLGKRA